MIDEYLLIKNLINKMRNAAFFLYTSKEVLILRKKDGYYKGQWSGPGGNIERGETPKEGAIRELKEETGIDYHNLEGEINIILRQDQTRIYLLKVKKIPKPKLSKEHDKYALVNSKDLDNYNLTPYFKETWEYIKEEKLL